MTRSKECKGLNLVLTQYKSVLLGRKWCIEYFNLMVHMKWSCLLFAISRLLLACCFCHVIVSPKTLVFLFLYFLSICCGVFFYFRCILFIFCLFFICSHYVFCAFQCICPLREHRTYVICLIFCIGVAALCWPWERMPIMTGFCSWRQGVWFFLYPKLHFTFVVQLFWSHAATQCEERDT